MRSALLVLVAAFAVGGFCVGVANVAEMFRGCSGARAGSAALLVRAPDGRCWQAHGWVKHENDALSWRTDGGLLVRVRGADWIEVVRGGGVNDQGLDWRGAAAVLGVDLSRCLPVAWSTP